jgi:hypothetical protein
MGPVARHAPSKSAAKLATERRPDRIVRWLKESLINCLYAKWLAMS